jgi:Ca-activated chloride channel family protein
VSFLYPKFLSLLLPLTIYILFRKKPQTLAQNMRWGALGLLIVAISQPVLRGSPSKIELPANSIVIGLDISASMRAEDIKPNREEATQATIREFLKLNSQDQIALIGFTTNPLLLSPFTTDHQLLVSALETLKVEYILTKGTDIKKLLQKVAKLSSGEPKLLILLSDGGDEVIDDSIMEILKGEDIEILTVAMATEFGASIPTRDGKLLKDNDGHIVVSKFNGELAKISKVLKFQTPQTTAQAILKWVEERDTIRRNLIYQHSNHTELFYIPTLLALILIFFSSTRFGSRLKNTR